MRTNLKHSISVYWTFWFSRLTESGQKSSILSTEPVDNLVGNLFNRVLEVLFVGRLLAWLKINQFQKNQLNQYLTILIGSVFCSCNAKFTNFRRIPSGVHKAL